MVLLTKQKKRQKILLGILVLVLIITIYAWYSGYQKAPSIEDEELIYPEEIVGSSATEEKFKTIKLDFSVLDNKMFKSLKSHGLLPVAKGETGRQNPFEPY